MRICQNCMFDIPHCDENSSQVRKIYDCDENSSLLWRLIIMMKNCYGGEHSSLWCKLIINWTLSCMYARIIEIETIIKFYHCDENFSLWWKSIKPNSSLWWFGVHWPIWSTLLFYVWLDLTVLILSWMVGGWVGVWVGGVDQD